MSLSGRRVAVIGAGAFGLASAVVLARAGALVELIDPEDGPSASAVAAGMLAPWSEWLLDPVATDHRKIFAAAHALWPDFASPAGVDLDASGTLHLGGEGALERERGRLAAAGVASRVLGRTEVEALAPQLSPSRGLHIPDERRLDPRQALAALDRAFAAAGGRRRRAPARAVEGGGVEVEGERLRADLIVMAAGAGGPAFASVFPELPPLSPIKGQLLRFPGVGGGGPTLRAEGVYLAPQAGGLLAGATMAAGQDDLAPDPAEASALRRAAAAAWPALADAPAEDRVGVRMAALDALPLVGWSSRPGVLLATGARRNGWLLAPLVAGMVAAYAAEGDPGPLAAALSPARFAGS